MDGCTSIYGYYLLYVFSLSVIGDSTKLVATNRTIEVNSSVSIQCVVSNVTLSLWSFRGNSNKTQTIASAKLSFISEASLNITSIPDTELSTYDLIIPFLSLELEGQYDCLERGETSTSVFIIVEVPPVVILKIDNDTVNGSIDTEVDHEVNVHCVAFGGHPSVSLSWEIDDQMPIADITVTMRRGAVVSELRYIPKREDKVIRCSTNGQITVESITVEANLNILYKPVCLSKLVNYNGDSFFFCQCSANPTPNISIMANDTFYSSEQTTSVTFPYPVNLSCLSSNHLGTVRSDPQSFLPSFNHHADETIVTPETGQDNTMLLRVLWIYIGLFVIGLVVIGLSLLFMYQCCLKRRKQARSFNVQARQREDNLQPQTWTTMSDRPPRPTPQLRTNVNRINAYSLAKEPLFNTTTTNTCEPSGTSPLKSVDGFTHNPCYATNKSTQGSKPTKDLLSQQRCTADDGLTCIEDDVRDIHSYHRIESVVYPEVNSNSEASQVHPTSHAYHTLEGTTPDTPHNGPQNSTFAFAATRGERFCEKNLKADDLTSSQDDDFETSPLRDDKQSGSPSDVSSHWKETGIPVYDDPPIE